MENAENNKLDTPQSREEDNALEQEETIPEASNEDIKIPIKFNKENRELSVKEAQALAQKGLKYDMITSDFARLRAMADKNKKSVGEFLSFVDESLKAQRRNEILSKCGGNEEMADKFMDMEEQLSGDNGQLEELKEYFPEIEDKSQLPQEVIATATEKGSRLLDEYLRHLYILQRQENKNKEIKKEINNHTLGSLKTEESRSSDPVRNMFLKGIWG